MIQKQQPALSLLCIGLMGMGVLSVVSQDFAYGWQPVPPFPGRGIAAVVCGLFMIAVSAALLYRSSSALAARALLPFLLAWQCLKIPAVVKFPQIEAVWLGFGEVAMLLAGGWALFASLSGLEHSTFFGRMTGERGIRSAQVIFGLAVIPVGLSHLIYLHITTGLVPAWLPLRATLAALTGIAQIACGLAMVFGVQARRAALLETMLVALFAFLVWGPDTWFATTPKMPGTPPGYRFPLTAFLITWVVGAAALLIAQNSAAASRMVANLAVKHEA
jgi:uncharacterized membrane protein